MEKKIRNYTRNLFVIEADNKLYMIRVDEALNTKGGLPAPSDLVNRLINKEAVIFATRSNAATYKKGQWFKTVDGDPLPIHNELSVVTTRSSIRKLTGTTLKKFRDYTNPIPGSPAGENRKVYYARESTLDNMINNGNRAAKHLSKDCLRITASNMKGPIMELVVGKDDELLSKMKECRFCNGTAKFAPRGPSKGIKPPVMPSEMPAPVVEKEVKKEAIEWDGDESSIDIMRLFIEEGRSNDYIQGAFRMRHIMKGGNK